MVDIYIYIWIYIWIYLICIFSLELGHVRVCKANVYMPVQDLKISIQLQNLHKYGSSFLKPTESDDQWNGAKYKWTKQFSSFWQPIIISIPLQCRLEQHWQGGSWPTSRRFWGMNRSHQKKLKWRMKPINFGYFRWLTLLEPKKTENSLKFAVFVNPTWVRHGVLMTLIYLDAVSLLLWWFVRLSHGLRKPNSSQ